MFGMALWSKAGFKLCPDPDDRLDGGMQGADAVSAGGPTSFAGLKSMTFGTSGKAKKRTILLGVLSKKDGGKGQGKASPTEHRMKRALQMAAFKK